MNDSTPLLSSKHEKQAGWGWNTNIGWLDSFLDWFTLLNKDNFDRLTN